MHPDRFKFPVRGVLSYDVYERGILVDRVEGENLIVDLARDIQSKALGGNSSYFVTQIGFGTNAAAPVSGNTTLTGAYTKALGTTTYPSSGIVVFNFTLGTTEANGMNISEFGLLTANGTLFSRKTRSSPLAKTSALSIAAGTWQITF